MRAFPSVASMRNAEAVRPGKIRGIAPLEARMTRGLRFRQNPVLKGEFRNSRRILSTNGHSINTTFESALSAEWHGAIGLG